jgi:hypothetical protein
MSILIVGGHECMEYEYKNIGSKKGHKVKVCLKLPARFEKAIGSPDGIVLFYKHGVP